MTLSNIIKLGMVFDESTAPDFGDISFDREHNLILTSTSLPKLTDNLTRAVCGAPFNIQTGTLANVIDTGAVLIYHPDAWYYVKRSTRNSEHYGTLSVQVMNDGAGYILSEADDEKIVFSVVSGGQTVLAKEMYLYHYKGNGLYSYKLNLEAAHTIHDLGENYTTNVAVYRGETDITSTVTINYPDVMEWYDAHIVFDTGV